MVEKDQNKILDEIFAVLAPGKPLRNAVDRIREASLGALIILTEPEEITYLMEGGFKLDTEFSPQKLYELAKMDGGIIVNREVTKIYGANLHLQPNHNIQTDESGTRHRTAHRIAKQTANMVITISERRNKVTVYKGDFKYTLDSIADLLIKSSQSVMSLEKYASLTTSYLTNLNYLEYEKLVTLEDIIAGIRIFTLLFKTDDNVEYYIRELGTEATTLQVQRAEVMLGQRNNFLNLIRDYYNDANEKKTNPEKIVEKISNIDITDENNIIKLLGYDPKQDNLEDVLIAKGYRLLNGINKLNKRDVENIIQRFTNINSILSASYDDLIQIKGINKIKGSVIMRTKERYKNIIELEKI
ncbi:DNA integrity scanning diadenylate cyclase DisA [Oceanivirga miroungae]|uniref:DNA integrity scanning protein DisA n=1 Tax=Oceanivirga miroungae TaxID=1130046 RepID=A0A6I8M8Z3_9FUSO|nr:DNA integrity scanning diadenylate cyclase DisA [Oceanivirga miroungae]VWL84768.1 DNA integrity scanning protein DisA [Oceanivirga miroungae]